MTDYRVRRTVFEKESVLTVENGALVRTVEGAVAQTMPLDQVHKVSLTYQPLTMGDRWVCSVNGPGGRIWFPSASFTGVGRVEDRRASFRPFVEALNLALANEPNAERTAFIQGSNLSAYTALILLILLAILGVLLVMALFGTMIEGKGLGSFAWAGLPSLVTLWAGRMVWAMWRRNRQGHYDPRAVPASFAPPT
jgi:hypothetical protein